MNNELYISQLTYEKEMERIMELKDDVIKVERLRELADKQYSEIQSQMQKINELADDLDSMHGKLYELMTDEEYEDYLDY